MHASILSASYGPDDSANATGTPPGDSTSRTPAPDLLSILVRGRRLPCDNVRHSRARAAVALCSSSVILARGRRRRTEARESSIRLRPQGRRKCPSYQCAFRRNASCRSDGAACPCASLWRMSPCRFRPAHSRGSLTLDPRASTWLRHARARMTEVRCGLPVKHRNGPHSRADDGCLVTNVRHSRARAPKAYRRAGIQHETPAARPAEMSVVPMRVQARCIAPDAVPMRVALSKSSCRFRPALSRGSLTLDPRASRGCATLARG
jgi:hypothetical protein